MVTASQLAMEPVVRIRRQDRSVTECAFDALRPQLFAGSAPWRTFRSRRGQLHLSGTYWSATMNDHVIYESRLEQANLLLADFDPTVLGIYAQPFQVEATIAGSRRRHVPDYVLLHDDTTITVVDVKPERSIDKPKVADTLAWSKVVVEEHGWVYRIDSEPLPQLLGNVRFLAGYRRKTQFPQDRVRAAARAVAVPMMFSEAESAIARAVGDFGQARAMALHLLWTRRLDTDLSRFSVVEPR